jgi:hypothetical protein
MSNRHRSSGDTVTHDAYYEITARTNAELGAELGRRFGKNMRRSIGYVRAEPHWRRKIAIAGEQIALTRRHLPRYVEEMEAYAAAAGVPLAEAWVVMCEDELDELAPEKCTTFVTNGGSLISHNEDWDADSADAVCILRKSVGDLTLLEIHYFNTPLGGSAITINSNGFVHAINTLSHTDDQVGVPRNVIARWLSETSDPDAAFRALKAIPRSAGYNHVLAGASGGVFDIECSAKHQALLRPALPFAHTNHYVCDDLAHLDAADEDDNTHPRYQSACALVKGSMTLAEAMAVGGDASKGREESIFNRYTIGRVVVDLKARLTHIWLRREAKAGWIAYPLDFMP